MPRGKKSTAFTIQSMINAKTKSNPQKKISILKRRSEFPASVREAIDEWKDEGADSFVTKIENRVLNLLKYNQYYGFDPKRGLNSDRDTEMQVELAIRFFPDLLSSKRGFYPITWQLRSGSSNREFNAKAAAFIPLLAKLTIELNQCQEKERGGLVNGEWSVLMELASRNDYEKDDVEHDRLVNATCLGVLKRLRQMKLFVKEDIRQYKLIRNICCEPNFPEDRFRYLANWDPDSLFLPSDQGWLPLHYSVGNSQGTQIARPENVCAFRTVLEVGIQKFSKQLGGLFHKNNNEETPYQMACVKFGNETVEGIVQKVVMDNRRNNDLETTRALIYAATHKDVHIDSVFYLLQREPSILQSCWNKKKRKPGNYVNF